MKSYEFSCSSMRISPHQPFVIRLDGHRFSKFIQGFKKPYDPRGTVFSQKKKNNKDAKEKKKKKNRPMPKKFRAMFKIKNRGQSDLLPPLEFSNKHNSNNNDNNALFSLKFITLWFKQRYP